MSPKIIEIVKGEEFKIKKTSIKVEDFFYNVYLQARDRLYEIVNSYLKKR